MSRPGAPLFDSAALRALLGEVDRELDDGEPIRIVACGGAVMLLKYDIRRTNDVDVISEPFPGELRSAAQTVGERHGLRDEWINDAAKISIPRLTPRFETLYSGRRLSVLSPGPHFILAMKLAACRDVDFDDAVRLIQEIGYRDVDQVLDLIDQAWGHTNISMSVEYFSRGVFEEATGGLRTPTAELSEPPPRTAGRPSLDFFD
ncbi:DUF6036 family nucleotidyltransferase [Candidatus Poriferisocius sp.]|uniref:DUF6036 family nucleotidyltransferase n=1 Tax=Candidatus Poriferisocius sp. TaxID=3101276 RepID=UPI003B020786